MSTKKTKYKPYREWYFEGYSRQQVLNSKTGKSKEVLVYTGEYYTYNSNNIPMFKLFAALMLILSIASAIAAVIIKVEFNRTWAGFSTLILFLPILFLIIPTGYLVLQKLPLTVRQVHSGYFEMSKWITWGFFFIVAVFACDIIFWITHKDTITFATDFWHPLLILVNAVVNRVWAAILKNNYPKKVTK